MYKNIACLFVHDCLHLPDSLLSVSGLCLVVHALGLGRSGPEVLLLPVPVGHLGRSTPLQQLQLSRLLDPSKVVDWSDGLLRPSPAKSVKQAAAGLFWSKRLVSAR